MILFQFLCSGSGLLGQFTLLLLFFTRRRFTTFQALAQGAKDVRARFQLLLFLFQAVDLDGQGLPVDFGKVSIFQQQLQIQLPMVQLVYLLVELDLSAGGFLNVGFQLFTGGFQGEDFFPVTPAQDKTGAIINTVTVVFFMAAAATFDLSGGGDGPYLPAEVVQLIATDIVKALGQFMFKPAVKLAVSLDRDFAAQGARVKGIGQWCGWAGAPGNRPTVP